jgi:hypothetical protein
MLPHRRALPRGQDLESSEEGELDRLPLHGDRVRLVVAGGNLVQQGVGG